jgi:pilus assembly protein FimV
MPVEVEVDSEVTPLVAVLRPVDSELRPVESELTPVEVEVDSEPR